MVYLIPFDILMLRLDQRVCCCEECALHTTTSGSGDIEGRIVSKRTYGLHQKRRRTPAPPYSADISGGAKKGPADTAGVDPSRAPDKGVEAFAAELISRSAQTPLTEGLLFVFPPVVGAPTPELPAMSQNDPCLHRLSLTSDAPANLPVSEYERWLLATRDEVLARTGGGGKLERLLFNLEGEFQTLQRRKVEEWQRQQGVACLHGRLKILSGSVHTSKGCILVDTGMRPHPSA